MPAPQIKKRVYRVYAGGHLEIGYCCGILVVTISWEEVSQMWGQTKTGIRASGKFEPLEGEWSELLQSVRVNEAIDGEDAVFEILARLEKQKRGAAPFQAVPSSS